MKGVIYLMEHIKAMLLHGHIPKNETIKRQKMVEKRYRIQQLHQGRHAPQALLLLLLLLHQMDIAAPLCGMMSPCPLPHTTRVPAPNFSVFCRCN